MSDRPKLPSCPSWCAERHDVAGQPHLRNIDIVSGPPFSRISVEVNVVSDDGQQIMVRVGVMDADAHLVSDDPSESESFHRLDLETAAALGHALSFLDPRGARMVGHLLVQAVEVARGDA